MKSARPVAEPKRTSRSRARWVAALALPASTTIRRVSALAYPQPIGLGRLSAIIIQRRVDLAQTRVIAAGRDREKGTYVGRARRRSRSLARGAPDKA